MFLLVKLHIHMGLEAVLPGPQNALYVYVCYMRFVVFGRKILVLVKLWPWRFMPRPAF